jgi:hypothetical protein
MHESYVIEAAVAAWLHNSAPPCSNDKKDQCPRVSQRQYPHAETINMKLIVHVHENHKNVTILSPTASSSLQSS